jgi:hypothetical protein
MGRRQRDHRSAAHGRRPVLLRHGSVFERLHRIARLLGPKTPGSGLIERGGDIDAAIRHLLNAHARLANALGWQFAGLIAECIETWVALRCLGVSVGFPQAVILESLTQAARQFIFIVPALLGWQWIETRASLKRTSDSNYRTSGSN